MKKTKKALLAFVACAAALTGVYGLAACKESGDDTGCAHEWSAWTVLEGNRPTAESGGKATRTCSKDGCDATDADKEYVLPPLNETDYVKGEDSATCAAGGTVTYTYNKDGVNVSITVNTPKTSDHEWGAWTVEDENKPTEENAGKATRTCTVDGCTAEAQEYPLPALNETDYVKGEDSATCAAGGTVTYTYNKDGVNVSITVNTPKTSDHEWGAWTVEDENKPTEENAGKATRTCTFDGCTAEAQEYPLPALNETDYVKGEDSATCAAGGTVTYTYNKDGVNVSITVDTPVNPAAHGTFEHHEAEFISCELGGNREYWECPLCEKKFDAEEGGNELTDVTTPAGHNYVLTVNNDGTATEACTNDGCTTGVSKTYKYINDDNAGTASALTPITTDDYYIESSTTTSQKQFWFRLDLTEAGIYKLDFEHLVDAAAGIINSVRLDGSTYVVNRRVTTDFTAIATSSLVAGKTNQSASFTFDATNYTGHYLLIQLTVQNQPKLKMSVSKDKAPLKVGDNTVSITEANAMFIDEYDFVPAETKSYSMTVPEGVEVLMNDEDFIVGGDTTVNFDGVADEIIVFAFKNSAAGNVTVTIGDAVEKLMLTPDTPVTNFTFTGHGVSVLEVGDIEAGKYTVTLNVTAALMRTYVYFGNNTSETYSDYFEANGNTVGGAVADVSFEGNAMRATVLNSDKVESAVFNRTIWTVTLNLQRGDKLVFVNSGNDGGVNSISMVKA